ncbi:MAG: sugar MFS transporter [Agriterribacter sp.]
MKPKFATIQVADLTPKQTQISIFLIGCMFFIFGFISWVNAILIPYFKIGCELNNVEAYLVAFAFYIAYFIMSVPAGYLLKKVGFKKGMMFGFWAMAAGAFIFIPAAYTRTYGVFLIGLFTIGIGLSILQTAANPYITILGPKERAAQRISIMGICNKAAGIFSPYIFAAVILRSTDNTLFAQLKTMTAIERETTLDELILRVVNPYLALGCFLFLLGYVIYRSPLPEIDTEHEPPAVASSNVAKKSIFDFPHLILGAIAIFLHVGTQIIAIDTVIGYADSMGIGLIKAKSFPSYTLFCTVCGYVCGILLIPRIIKQLYMLRICTILGLTLSVLILYARGTVHVMEHTADISIWFVVALGLANSLVWAGIWPLALDGLGRFTKTGASVLIMGLCGNAIMPLIYGYIGDKYHDLRFAYIVLIPCYLYLIFYAFKGYSVRRWK